MSTLSITHDRIVAISSILNKWCKKGMTPGKLRKQLYSKIAKRNFRMNGWHEIKVSAEDSSDYGAHTMLIMQNGDFKCEHESHRVENILREAEQEAYDLGEDFDPREYT